MADLNPDGLHSPAHTAEAANLLAGCVRYLNHASMAGSGGLEYPGDAYDLLGALYTATQRLPQLCDQLAVFLVTPPADGRLADSQGRDPAIQAGMAADLLREAADRIPALTAHLQRAQNDIAGLYVREASGD